MGEDSKNSIPYVKLGKTGLKVSRLGFGSWVTFGRQIDVPQAKKIIRQCFDGGINFFDNAEVYEAGKSEEIMGQAFKELNIPRNQYVITTKLLWGTGGGPNDKGLNRKKIIESTKASLKRLQLEYVDVIYAHRPDPSTPIEETVRAFNYVIDQGWAFYWGTSEWSAQQIQEAFGVADRLGLIAPAVEQPEYNLLERKKSPHKNTILLTGRHNVAYPGNLDMLHTQVEQEYLPLYEHGLGLTTWSPLASGLLTGKYSKDHQPEGSRFALEKYQGLKDRSLQDHKLEKVDKLKEIAKQIGATLPQFAIAWCAKNKNVSVVLLGATKAAQIEDNLASLQFVDKITPDILKQVDELFGNNPGGVKTYFSYN